MGCVCGWEVATFVQCCKMPNEMVNPVLHNIDRCFNCFCLRTLHFFDETFFAYIYPVL